MRSLQLCSLLWLVAFTNALHFYLDTNERRCFIEELPTDTVVEGACGCSSRSYAGACSGTYRAHPQATTRH